MPEVTRVRCVDRCFSEGHLVERVLVTILVFAAFGDLEIEGVIGLSSLPDK